MRSLLNNKLVYIISISFLILGIAIGIPFTIYGFSFSWKIELFDILSLIVTIFLAIYVVAALERRVQDDRVEKELHIEQICKIEAILNEIENSLRDNCISYNNINSRISKIRIKKNILFNTLKNYLSEENCSLEKITLKIEVLKRLLTDTSVNFQNEAVMKDGIIKYSKQRLSDINNSICGLENELYLLKIRINRL